MPAKPKTLMKTGKAKKKKEPTLNDADDYLAAGGDAEDAMGKHRGGDVPKALRFADRALGLYNEGLTKFPNSPDLAYNRARLELEIATHPSFVTQLEDGLESLQKALSSHQYALKLDPDNADLLFNTAQVLTAIAEQVAQADNTEQISITYLHEAIEIQSRCLAIQEAKFSDSRNLQQSWQSISQGAPESDQDDEEDGGASLRGSDAHREEEERWVTVIEPITANTLLDTILAQIGTLTTLCSVILRMVIPPSEISSAMIEKLADESVGQALPQLLAVASGPNETLADRAAEIAVTKANLASNFLEMGFHRSEVDIETYKRLLEEAFNVPEFDTSLELQIAYAKAVIAFNSSIEARPGENQPYASVRPNLMSMRWNMLSKAQKALATASALPAAKDDTTALANTHLLRGDISLLLLAMATPSNAHEKGYDQAQTNAKQLLSNAEVFYRNAAKLSATVSDIDEAAQAQLKGAVVNILQKALASSNGDYTAVLVSSEDFKALKAQRFGTKSPQWIQEQMEQFLDEGLVLRAHDKSLYL